MTKLFQKRTLFVSILFGLILFFGGATGVSAIHEPGHTDQAVTTSGSSDGEDVIYAQLNCSPLRGKFADCGAVVIYYVVYIPAFYALMGAGYFFDTALSLSIDNSKKMVTPDFVGSSWTVVRDFSNMLFIFVLLYTGIMTMFGAADWRKVVLQVVIVALLINFSLFFTKVVIDAGNILAVGIKSSISPGQSLSEGLAGAFQPQRFLLAPGKLPAGKSIIVFFVAAVVSGFAAYYFFKAALLFAGRLIAFWFLMIVSPFAFISITLPKANVFDKWLSTLLNQAFVAPVFLFFIYLIMQAISSGSGILENFMKPEEHWFKSLLGPIIIATLLVLALKKSLDFAAGMAGEFGKAGSSFVSGALGVAAGVAMGGTGLVGRAVGGRLAQRIQESGTFQKMATGENALGRFAGRQGIALTDKARTGTWDARGLGLVQKGAQAAGIKIEKPGESVKGGFEGAMKRQEKQTMDEVKKYKVTEQEKAKVEGYAPKEKAKEAKEAVATSGKRVAEATQKMNDAQTEHDTMRNSGKLDPNMSKFLDAAKKEKAAADEALAKAEEVSKKIEDASDTIEKENQRRRRKYAEHLQSKVRTGIVLATGNLAYSHDQANRSADKILKNTIEKQLEEEKEKKKEDRAEKFEKIMDKDEGKGVEKEAKKAKTEDEKPH